MVDSVMDIDYCGGRITYEGSTRSSGTSREQGWKLAWISDPCPCRHLSSRPTSAEARRQARIGENITIVQDTFGQVFNEGYRVPARRIPVRRPVCGWRFLHDRHHDRLVDAHPGTRRLHDACGGRCGLPWATKLFHAGWRLGAGRFPRRRRTRTLRLDEAGAGVPRKTRLFHVARLREIVRDIQWETTVADERAHPST